MDNRSKQSKGTSTSNFGVSKRESHDSSAFYRRFRLPNISDDATIRTSRSIDQLFCQDAREMKEVDDASVALVVTSPPYFAGKEYETALGEGHVPGDYKEYLDMLRDVFDECAKKLEPGGRIAVNVANLGRKPYRSLSSDVIGILQDDLGLLLRGEVIWEKAKGSTGSCAWGSFQRPANPVLRDLTERIIIASKGRFDRALNARTRFKKGLPSEASISSDRFMELTTDVWDIPPESAHRVGHPAPFPVALPEQLIQLYTYRNDLVLDPFIGSGTTAVASIRNERHYVGYDTDETYIRIAQERIDEEREQLRKQFSLNKQPIRVRVPAVPQPVTPDEDFQARAVREGRAARKLALEALEICGFDDIKPNAKFHQQGIEVNFVALDHKGRPWHFDVSGGFTSNRPGLKRTDTLWKALGKAAVLHQSHPTTPLVLLTTDLPEPRSAGNSALKQLLGPNKPIFDVIDLSSPDDLVRLARYSGLEDAET